MHYSTSAYYQASSYSLERLYIFVGAFPTVTYFASGKYMNPRTDANKLQYVPPFWGVRSLMLENPDQTYDVLLLFFSGFVIPKLNWVVDFFGMST